MKKRLFLIVAIATLTTATWADISIKQLNTYMKVSGANVVLKEMQKQITSDIETKARMRGEEISQIILNEIRKIVSSKENLAYFTKGIKALNEKDYKEIIKFYNTKIGKKNADLVQNENMLTMQKEIESFSKKKLSKERRSLIVEAVDATMLEKKMEKMGKLMMEIRVESLPLKVQADFREKMKVRFEKMKPMMREQAIKSTAYIYRDFSDAELKLLIEHYKMPSAQKETDAIIEGGAEYIKVVMSQILLVTQNAPSGKSW